jgi:hypothetical protein
MQIYQARCFKMIQTMKKISLLGLCCKKGLLLTLFHFHSLVVFHTDLQKNTIVTCILTARNHIMLFGGSSKDRISKNLPPTPDSGIQWIPVRLQWIPRQTPVPNGYQHVSNGYRHGEGAHNALPGSHGGILFVIVPPILSSLLKPKPSTAVAIS